jgi:hypothetical protein
MQKKLILLTTTLAMVFSLAACAPNAMDENDYRNNANRGNQSGSAMLGNDTNVSRYDTYANRYRGDGINNHPQGFYNANRMNPGLRYDGTLNNNRNGMNPWAYNDDRRGFNDDGFLGYTNGNPNLFNNNGNGRFETRDTTRDADIMADLAARVAGVDDATVGIFGGTAFVALDIDQNMSNAKQLKAQNEVRQQLQSKMPRYRINITSDALWISRLRNLGTGENDGNNIRGELNDLGRSMNVR